MLKKTEWILIRFIIFIQAFSVSAQNSNCDCRSDFKYLKEQLKSLPAYRSQERLMRETINELSNSALVEIDSYPASSLDCLFAMNRWMLLLNDNHSRIHGPNSGISTKHLKNKASLDSIKGLPFFLNREKRQLDLDSLTSSLLQADPQFFEGIYYWRDRLTIGIYQKEDYYEAIILESDLALFSPRDLLYKIQPYGINNMLLIGYSLASRRLIAFNDRFEKGMLVGMNFRKEKQSINYHQNPYRKTFLFKPLNEEADYMKAGSFGSFYPTLSQAETFYDSIQSLLNKPNLILDLRGNTGGGRRNSDILYKILSKYLKIGKIHLIVSQRTMSNAEQFAIRLSKSKNVIIYGRNTNGTLAYEIKNSIYTLPYSQNIAVLTSKKYKKYMPFESIGYQPQILLKDNRSWVDQVQEHIN